MAKLIPTIEVGYKLLIELNYEEAEALSALPGYGTDVFLKVFYAQLGEAYLKPYEKGLRSLLERVRAQVPDQLHTVRRFRKLIDEQVVEINKL